MHADRSATATPPPSFPRKREPRRCDPWVLAFAGMTAVHPSASICVICGCKFLLHHATMNRCLTPRTLRRNRDVTGHHAQHHGSPSGLCEPRISCHCSAGVHSPGDPLHAGTDRILRNVRLRTARPCGAGRDPEDPTKRAGGSAALGRRRLRDHGGWPARLLEEGDRPVSDRRGSARHSRLIPPDGSAACRVPAAASHLLDDTARVPIVAP